MQLLHSFFQITEKTSLAEETKYRIHLNAAHPIYADHFPGNPITPGVCMIQIIKELVRETIGSDLFLRKIVRVRYHQVIDPVATPDVELSIQILPQEDNDYKITAIFSTGEQKCAQFNLLIQPLP
ncbi:3-hydroxyacyl-[acyl-carrier-protein] dehydratase [Parabacteroides sp. PFB2-10]|uniref:hypothetical protein n=1 Tax=Parabacteroides sp. PFB2-10 TaxID=1742405 RepID=UPI0024737C3B|nr:hypothetical protein [Parabacteroides sp. PFB2-10]MDH6313465.1 3-hydroxyacyl-[acyl-carrier-protein] dehydratase [Parabacteroides sp. PFB2-10]